MKKTNFPSSMIVVAAVVAFGMVGSQLDLGGLSGQAAGGEAAGCGGDAYYDEDLGALVDSEGNILDEDGNVASAGEEGSLGLPAYEAHTAGQAMQGQNLVTIIRPVGFAAQDLAELDGQTHRVEASINDDGTYAILNFIADDAAELNQTQILQRDGDEWVTIWAIESDRSTTIDLGKPAIVDVVEDTIVRFTLGAGYSVLELDLEAKDIRVVSDSEMEEIVAEKSALFSDDPEAFRADRLAVAGLRAMVEVRTEHDWLGSFVADQFGNDVDYTFTTSLNNQMLVGLSTGAVLAINGCEVGDEPINAGGELVCRSCNESDMGCVNVLNRADMLNASIETRLEMRTEGLDMLRELNMLRQRPTVDLGVQAELFKAKGWNHQYADWAQNKAYDCAGGSCYHDGSETLYVPNGSSCKFVVRGSDDAGDWASNLNLFGDGNGQHRGFRNGANAIDRAMSSAGISHCGGNTVWIGHSRGAAIATILARRHGGKVFSFAGPRTDWGDKADVPGKRFMHAWDVVTSLGASRHNIDSDVKSDRDCNWRGCGSWHAKNAGDNEGGGTWRFWDLYSAHVDYYDDHGKWD